MIKTLNSHPLFALLSREEIALLNGIGLTQVFHEGDSLISIGERTRDVLCIGKGEVSVHIEDAAGNSLEIAQLPEGSLIGEMNFIIPIRRTAHVVALSEVRVNIFPYQDFCKLLTDDANLASKIFTALNLQLTARYLNMLKGL